MVTALLATKQRQIRGKIGIEPGSSENLGSNGPRDDTIAGQNLSLHYID
jgi:hypothetical protein